MPSVGGGFAGGGIQGEYFDNPHLSGNPAIILETLNPLNALTFFMTDGFRAFIAMGSVVLAVTRRRLLSLG